MLTLSMVAGVHVKTPVFASKCAPAGSSVSRFSVTTSPSLSYVVTLSSTSWPIVTFITELTVMSGLLLAEILHRTEQVLHYDTDTIRRHTTALLKYIYQRSEVSVIQK